MWQLSECIDGMAEACRALALPVIGGNVSFYNESGGADIDPTPVLGRARVSSTTLHAPPTRAGVVRRRRLVLVGPRAAADGSFPLEGTRWATERRGHRTGRIPAGRLRGARRDVCLRGGAGGGAGRRRRTASSLVHAVHDVSGGGLAVALAEMAAAAGTAARWTIERRGRALHGAALTLRGGHGRRPTSCAPGPPPLGVPTAVLGRAGGARVHRGGAARPARRGPVRGARGEPRPGPGGTVMPRACARMGGA